MSVEAARRIRIPYQYTPRSYQLPVWQAIEAGVTRLCLVWHRRAGKDKTALNIMVSRALGRVGSYYYFLPTAVQGRKVIWDGIDRDGFRFLDHLPVEIRDGEPNQTEMKVKLRNGSIIQVIGTDNYDAIRGTNPVGVVLSEYAYQDPRAWDTVRPILAENGGWAIFATTPNGRNHGYELYRMATTNPDWYASRLTVSETQREDGSPLVSSEAIEAERAAGMSEDMIQQEYFCSFTGVTVGSYYGRLIEAAEAEGRIGRVPWDPRLPVETWWDLGVGDATAIWMSQTVNREIRMIDYYESSGEGLPHYVRALKERAYVYGAHHAPHDIAVREFSTGKSRLETAESLGIKFTVVRRPPGGANADELAEGIEAVRSVFPGVWFDRQKCQRGLDCLASYRKAWDESRKCFATKPSHDWSSHGADAFRYFALGHEFPRPMVKAPAPGLARGYAVR